MFVCLFIQYTGVFIFKSLNKGKQFVREGEIILMITTHARLFCPANHMHFSQAHNFFHFFFFLNFLHVNPSIHFR